MKKIDRNSAAVWFPPIEKLLPVPKTIMVEYDHVKFVEALETGQYAAHVDPKHNEIKLACEQIGYPCFIKTDLTSAKHNGPSDYLVPNKKVICRFLS